MFIIIIIIIKYNTALHVKFDEGVCAYSAIYIVSLLYN